MSDTPRTDALEFPVFHRPSFIMHARQLERELSAATAELAATKEQLRVAREALVEVDKCRIFESESMDIDGYTTAIVHQALTFTQPNLSADSLGGGNPAKGEGGVPSTFPA